MDTTNISYEYDKTGNIVKDAKHVYSYDSRNRLTAIDSNVTYQYNYANKRVSKTVNGVKTYFIYDGHMLVGEYQLNLSDNSRKEYVYLNSTPIATITPKETYRVYADHLDTSRRVATNNEEATILWKWESKPFGETEANEDVDGDGKAFVQNLRFPGQYFDAETATHYNINRNYNPVTGRYIQSDPIGFRGGYNGYLYANGNSLIYKDINGLYAKIEHNNKSVRITISIAFKGAGATTATINKFKDGIEKYWTGEFGKYRVQTIVLIEAVGTAKNIIKVPKGNARSFVDYRGANGGTWSQDSGAWVAAHEAGHLMGLDDRYADNSAGLSVPYKGWGNNIMGAHGQPVQEKNIAGVISNPVNSSDIILKPASFEVAVGVNTIMIFVMFFVTMIMGLFMSNSSKEDNIIC